jgi:hypothetical protein
MRAIARAYDNGEKSFTIEGPNVALALKKYTLIPSSGGIQDPRYPDGHFPPSTPVLGAVSVVSATEIDIQLQTAAIGGVAPVSYVLEHSATSASTGFSVLSYNAFTIGTDTTYEHTGLTPSTQHWYRVYAIDSNSTPRQSVTSAAVSGTTPAAPGGGDVTAPTVPVMTAATSVTATTITFNWNASTDAVGVTGYRVVLGLGDGAGNPVQSLGVTDVGNVLTKAYTGLNSVQQYYARVEAYDAAGNASGYSARQFVSTSTSGTTANRFVAPTGNDSPNTGAAGQPWLTITKMNTALQAGEVCEIQAASPGGTVSHTNQAIAPVNNGGPSNWLEIQVRSGDTARLIGNSTNSNQFPINFDGKQYIKVTGISLDGEVQPPSARIQEFINIENSRNIIIDGNNKQWLKANGWSGAFVGEGAEKVLIKNFDMRDVGVWSETDNQESGDMVYIQGAQDSVVRDGFLRRGGHGAFTVRDESSQNVYMYNVESDGDWSAVEGADTGEKSFITTSAGKVFYCNNIARNSKLGSGSGGVQPMSQFGSVGGHYHRMIFSNCWDIHGSVVLWAGSRTPGYPQCHHNMLSHSVIYYGDNAALWADRNPAYGTNQNEFHHWYFVNNIFYKNRRAVHSPIDNYNVDVLIQVAGVTSANMATYFQFRNNCIMKDTPGDAMIEVYGVDRKSLAAWQTTHPNVFSGNVSIAPNFAGGDPNPATCSKSDFTLAAASNLINAGAHLAVTVGANTGNTISVSNVLPFFASQYMDDGTLMFDDVYAQVGSNTPREIVSVSKPSFTNIGDGVQGTITLSGASMTWASGVGVNLVPKGFAGLTGNPNIGYDQTTGH